MFPELLIIRIIELGDLYPSKPYILFVRKAGETNYRLPAKEQIRENSNGEIAEGFLKFKVSDEGNEKENAAKNAIRNDLQFILIREEEFLNAEFGWFGTIAVGQSSNKVAQIPARQGRLIKEKLKNIYPDNS